MGHYNLLVLVTGKDENEARNNALIASDYLEIGDYAYDSSNAEGLDDFLRKTNGTSDVCEVYDFQDFKEVPEILCNVTESRVFYWYDYYDGSFEDMVHNEINRFKRSQVHKLKDLSRWSDTPVKPKYTDKKYLVMLKAHI